MMKKGIRITEQNLGLIKFRIEKMINENSEFESIYNYNISKKENDILRRFGIKFKSMFFERIEKSNPTILYKSETFVDKELNFRGSKDCFLRIRNSSDDLYDYSAFLIFTGDKIKFHKKSIDILASQILGNNKAVLVLTFN